MDCGDRPPDAGPCPAGGEHTWTDAVGPQHEHLPASARWHCDECGAPHPGHQADD